MHEFTHYKRMSTSMYVCTYCMYVSMYVYMNMSQCVSMYGWPHRFIVVLLRGQVGLQPASRRFLDTGDDRVHILNA